MRGGKRYWQFKQESAFRSKSFAISPRLRGTCNMTAFCMLVYALFAQDVPVGMVALAVMTGTVPALDFLGERLGRALQQVMQAFSITLFVGAVLLMVFS